MNLCDYVDFEIVEIIRWEGCVPSVFSASGVFNTHAEKMAVFPQILLFELLLISLSVAERQLSEPEVLNNSTIVDPSPPFNDDVYNVLLSTKEKYHIPLIGKRSVDQTLPRVRREDKSVFTQFDSKLKLETNKENKKVIRIGHLGATGIMPNDAKVLNASKMELIENGLIPPSLEFEIVSRITCSESYEGVAVAAELYHTHQVRAFIGPYCSAELESVVKMATFWNIPIISYSSTSNSLTDRNIYKTLARISSKNVNAIAEATVALLQHYKWTKIGIITNTGVEAFERVQVFEEILHRVGITVLRKVMLEESARSTEIISSGLLSEMAGSARIIVCMFSNTLDLSKEVMKATKILEINNAEYAYVIPWMQGGAKDTSPWIGADGEMLQKVKDDYANAIIVDDVNGFDDSIVTSFLSKLEKYGVTKNELDLSNIYGYIHLYDSLKLYALAIKKTLEESGNEAFVTNGQYIWNKMRRTSFEGVVTTSDNQTDGDTKTGAIGTVIMDDLVDRAPIFAAFYISPKRSDVLKMVNINSELMSNCDGLKNRSGCFNLNITDITRDFWISENGALPLDEPVCGYKGQKCSYLMEILFGVIALVLVILAVGAHTLYRICETRALDKMPWRVFHEDLQFIDDEQVKSMMSVSSANTKISNMSVGQKRHVIIGVNTHSTYHKYVQRRPIKFGREDLQLLSQMKQCVHDNINPFLGMAFNEKEEMLILWKFCSRGTVQDIIYNKNVILDEKFHAAFVRDITLGLEYLHASSIGYHGSLTPWACLIDRNWMVKLSDYGIANPLERWDQQGAITIELPVDADDKSQASQKTSVLYCAPEMLKTKASNSKRRMDQSWIKQSQLRRQAGDIYSFGMVMYEILFRSLPYKQGTDYSELCDYLSDGSKIITPEIQDQMGCHPDLQALLRDCWSENPEIRPSIRRVRLNTEMVLKTKGSLVDQMMRMMEQYANNLEKTVKERTGMLEDANIRADQLLSQLLPKYVANELKLGRAVAPKLFSSATVLFSDIVGFTTICSSSSPLEVVTMLNGLYTGFDECITRNESYKVETIGDAYMVVSGVPEENGYNHSRNIANVALDMRQYLNSYKVPHRPSHRIRCRWGFHTGSVAAGVVGMTAPRYCLFGDTVNTASRMESSGTPGMVQLSDEAHHHLANHWPIFSLTPRGEIEVKGKGKVMTYWLEDRIGDENTANYINEENQ